MWYRITLALRAALNTASYSIEVILNFQSPCDANNILQEERGAMAPLSQKALILH